MSHLIEYSHSPLPICSFVGFIAPINYQTWLLELPETTTITNSVNDNSEIVTDTRMSKVEYDPNHPGLIFKTIREEGDIDKEVIVEMVRNNHGQVTETFIEADGERISQGTITYDTEESIFPVKDTNTLGHVSEILDFDRADGLPLEVKDVNGQIMNVEYDGMGRMVRAEKPGSPLVVTNYLNDTFGDKPYDLRSIVYRKRR